MIGPSSEEAPEIVAQHIHPWHLRGAAREWEIKMVISAILIHVRSSKILIDVDGTVYKIINAVGRLGYHEYRVHRSDSTEQRTFLDPTI